VAFQGLFVYLGLALAFAVLAAVLRSPRFKGWRGGPCRRRFAGSSIR
jgi:hypothetical protein